MTKRQTARSVDARLGDSITWGGTAATSSGAPQLPVRPGQHAHEDLFSQTGSARRRDGQLLEHQPRWGEARLERHVHHAWPEESYDKYVQQHPGDDHHGKPAPSRASTSPTGLRTRFFPIRERASSGTGDARPQQDQSATAGPWDPPRSTSRCSTGRCAGQLHPPSLLQHGAPAAGSTSSRRPVATDRGAAPHRRGQPRDQLWDSRWDFNGTVERGSGRTASSSLVRGSYRGYDKVGRDDRLAQLGARLPCPRVTSPR